MKKIVFIMLSALILAACSNAEAEKEKARKTLAAEAIATNSQLKGMQIDLATTCDGCEFKDDVFHYYYTVNEEFITIESLETHKDEMKESITEVLESTPETKELIRLMESINGKIIYHYTGSTSGANSDITIQY